MSLQTALARAAARDAEDASRQHQILCPACGAAVRGRHYAEMCPEGAEARQLASRLRADAKREAELDRLPHPDQGTLFDLDGPP